MPGQQLADRRDTAVELVDLGVDLDAIAGADHQGPRDVTGAVHVTQQLDERVAGHRRPLERRHRRALVAEAYHQDAHVAIARAGTPVASPSPSVPAAADSRPPRRRAWRASQSRPPSRPTLT